VQARWLRSDDSDRGLARADRAGLGRLNGRFSEICDRLASHREPPQGVGGQGVVSGSSSRAGPQTLVTELKQSPAQGRAADHHRGAGNVGLRVERRWGDVVPLRIQTKSAGDKYAAIERREPARQEWLRGRRTEVRVLSNRRRHRQQITTGSSGRCRDAGDPASRAGLRPRPVVHRRAGRSLPIRSTVTGRLSSDSVVRAYPARLAGSPDRGIDRLDPRGDLPAGVRRAVGQYAHFLWRRPEATSCRAASRRFDGRVDRQQMVWCAMEATIARHLFNSAADVGHLSMWSAVWPLLPAEVSVR